MKQKHKARIPGGKIIKVMKSLNKRGVTITVNSLSQRVKRWKGGPTNSIANSTIVNLLPTTVTIFNNDSSIASTITNGGLSIQAEVDPSKGS